MMDLVSKRPKRSTAALSSARVFNTDSPITKRETDIQTFLSICLLNWSQYSEEDKKSIIEALPLPYRTTNYSEEGKISCPISPDFVANDKTVRDQIARFKRDVGDGYYTKTWQEKAKKATEERAQGKFDEYLTKHSEELFAGEDEADASSSDAEYSSKTKVTKDKAAKNRKGANKISRATASMIDVERVDENDQAMDEFAG